MPRGLARDHADKRDAIRRAAAAYFAQAGYARATMEGAARACGTSKALIYHYYASKEALLHDILEAHLADLARVVEVVPDGPAETRFRALLAAILAAYRDADAEHRLQIDALATLPEEMQRPLRDLQRRLVAAMEAALIRLRPDLAGSDRLKPAAMSVYAMLNWYFLWYRPGRDITREDYAGMVADLVLGGLPAVAA
ncbi:MAG: TetR/AcrR family transcriptional regulator [Rhodobacteraceae bacterium]|nr:TetR/AcrR family transcriptional regulator [Paracoccaceae bacterium]